MESRSMGSVTYWIEDLKKQEPQAQLEIWNRFADRLRRFAKSRLFGKGCRIIDADDIANMAYTNFLKASPDRFNSLINRNDLWQILAVLAERRVIDQIRKELTQRNGRGTVVSESVIRGKNQDNEISLDSFTGGIQPPDYELMLAEEAEGRLDMLETDQLRDVALARVHGYRNAEIAELLQMKLRTVERCLKKIRDAFLEAQQEGL